MALLLCCALGGGTLPAAGALAQDPVIPDVTYPSLPKQASSAAGFVPRGWVLEAQASGDLNRDAIPDLALVLRQNDPKNIVKNPGLGENPFDTNPRILAVAFRNGPAGDFVLQLENRTLIPRRTDPVMADPFEDGLAIDRGNLRVNLNLWLSAGGWDMSGMSHTLQYRNGRLELIGYDRSTTNRRSLDTTDVSVNYLSGKMKISTGNSNSDKPAKAIWKTLPRRAPLTIDEIGNGLEFEPKP
ncbi:MAG TPA: hypothetical protein VE423_00730 [Microvirga sp.]|nr:hypothetical protein [Microvirga sp.]